MFKWSHLVAAASLTVFDVLKIMTLVFPRVFQIHLLLCLAMNPLEEALQTLVLWQRYLSAKWHGTFFTHTLAFNETDSIKISSQNYFLLTSFTRRNCSFNTSSLVKHGDVYSLALAVLKWALIDLFNRLPAASVPGLYSLFVVFVSLSYCASLLFSKTFVNMYRCKAKSIGEKFCV